MIRRTSPALLALALLGCASPPEAPEAPLSDAEHRDRAVAAMHDTLLADLRRMRAEILDLQAAAPADHGWDARADAEAIASMRGAWARARTAYERVEGALAPLFPDLDNAVDARYDDFMTQLAARGGDGDLFDGEGVTGMHAVERVLYADVTPARVVAFERSLPGYRAAAFPATAAEASSFRRALVARLLADVDVMEAQWTPANIDATIAFQGLVLLVQEQREKVQKAASSEEESRYAQRTMADLRDNLAGARAVYAAFRPWLVSKASDDPARDGAAIDGAINAGLDALEVAYAEVDGDAIPAPPATWRAEGPTAEDLATPFGRLYTAVRAAVDPATPGSAAASLEAAAGVLGLAEIGEAP